jgi:hypothetical protein
MSHPSLPPQDEASERCDLCGLTLNDEGVCAVHGDFNRRELYAIELECDRRRDENEL